MRYRSEHLTYFHPIFTLLSLRRMFLYIIKIMCENLKIFNTEIFLYLDAHTRKKVFTFAFG